MLSSKVSSGTLFSRANKVETPDIEISSRKSPLRVKPPGGEWKRMQSSVQSREDIKIF